MALSKTALKSQLSVSIGSLFNDMVKDLPTTTPEQQALKTQAELNMGALSDKWATAISDAVDTYVRTAVVTVLTGIPVSTTGTAAAQIGATTGTGTGGLS